jgi:hypothetical protein
MHRPRVACNTDTKELTMHHDQLRLPLATRLLSLAFAAVVSLGRLAGVDALATGEPDAGQMARAQVSVKA